MFDTAKEDLKDILRKVDEGKLQLPDFQRDYVWGDEDVRSLIASIAKAFPVGALLTLETGGEVEFQPRLLEGVAPKEVRPLELLLDGQQRMTSLFQATFAKAPVRTKTVRGMLVERFYYLDINKAIASPVDLDEAIVGVPADRIVRTDFGKHVVLDVSTREREFENDLFPLNQVFDSHNWFFDWRDYWRARGREVSDLHSKFYRGVVEAIERYKMPIIRLDRSNTREAICVVFEKVNVGGKKLDAFELITAMYAGKKFDLREDWNGARTPAKPGRRARMIGFPNRRDVLSQIASTDFLQACALLLTREKRLEKAAAGAKDKELPQVSCKREALLGLPLAAYEKHADGLEAGFIEAGGFPQRTQDHLAQGRFLSAADRRPGSHLCDSRQTGANRAGQAETRAVVLVRHSRRTVRIEHRIAPGQGTFPRWSTGFAATAAVRDHWKRRCSKASGCDRCARASPRLTKACTRC
jgi:hypothetical protein